MRTIQALFTTAVTAATLWGAGPVAYATGYTANSWDCTQVNASSACAQADLPPMTTARGYMATAAAPDGFIYAIGGKDATSVARTVEAFSPSTGWLPAALMPTARYSSSALSVPTTGNNGHVFVMGGTTASLVPTDIVEVYDTASNSWGCSYSGPNCSNALYKPLPTARNGLSATRGADGRIYTLGGNDTSGVSSVVEAYDLSTNTWDCSTGDTAPGCSSFNLKPLPTARAYGGAVTGIDGHIYLIGGVGATDYANFVESYDPTTKTWLCSVGDGGCAPGAQTLASMPTARGFFGMARGPDNQIYVIGGHDINGVLDRVEAYSPGGTAGSWVCSQGDIACSPAAQTLKPLPTARYGVTATVGPDHRIYMIGGRTPNMVSTVEAYTVPASGPTAARVSRTIATRRGVFVEVRWQLSEAHGIAGFLVYGGHHRLTGRAIQPHTAPNYRVYVRWSGTLSHLSLRLLFRDGHVVRIAVQ